MYSGHAMNLLSFFAIVVYAAESLISPVPQSVLDGRESVSSGSAPVGAWVHQKPATSFGDLSAINPAVPEADEVPLIEVTPSPTPVPLKTITPTPVPLKTATPTTPAPTAKPQSTHKARKPVMSIAVLGDSMVDTLGRDLGILQNRLQAQYPGTRFNMYNHGVGATNIDYGITRITTAYTYLGMQLDSVAGGHPDVVVIESFGYNPFPVPDALNRHWLALARAVDTVRSSTPDARIVIAATIAPNRDTFGDGAAGLSFSAQDKIQRTENIKSYLDNAVKFAKSQKLPLADAFHATMDASGNGKLMYISGGDHIHYSELGRQFFSAKVADTIIQNRLLE